VGRLIIADCNIIKYCLPFNVILVYCWRYIVLLIIYQSNVVVAYVHMIYMGIRIKIERFMIVIVHIYVTI